MRSLLLVLAGLVACSPCDSTGEAARVRYVGDEPAAIPPLRLEADAASAEAARTAAEAWTTAPWSEDPGAAAVTVRAVDGPLYADSGGEADGLAWPDARRIHVRREHADDVGLLTHEIGHVLGFAHTADAEDGSPYPKTIMSRGGSRCGSPSHAELLDVAQRSTQ